MRLSIQISFGEYVGNVKFYLNDSDQTAPQFYRLLDDDNSLEVIQIQFFSKVKLDQCSSVCVVSVYLFCGFDIEMSPL